MDQWWSLVSCEMQDPTRQTTHTSTHRSLISTNINNRALLVYTLLQHVTVTQQHCVEEEIYKQQQWTQAAAYSGSVVQWLLWSTHVNTGSHVQQLGSVVAIVINTSWVWLLSDVLPGSNPGHVLRIHVPSASEVTTIWSIVIRLT